MNANERELLQEARDALAGLVEVSELATMVSMFGYPEGANGPLPTAKAMVEKLDASLASAHTSSPANPARASRLRAGDSSAK